MVIDKGNKGKRRTSISPSTFMSPTTNFSTFVSPRNVKPSDFLTTPLAPSAPTTHLYVDDSSSNSEFSVFRFWILTSTLSSNCSKDTSSTPNSIEELYFFISVWIISSKFCWPRRRGFSCRTRNQFHLWFTSSLFWIHVRFSRRWL